MIERWEPIESFEEFYSVSDLGRVYRHPRRITRVSGRPYWASEGLLAAHPGNKAGHLAVTLYDAAGHRHKCWIHRLVAQAFIPNPEGLPYVLHGPNGVLDNRASELRWGNQSANEMDKLRHRIANRGGGLP